jgi:hypothetical protein
MPKVSQVPAGNLKVLEQMDEHKSPNENSVDPLPSAVESDSLREEVDVEGGPQLDVERPSWGEPIVVVTVIAEPSSKEPIQECVGPVLVHCSLHGVVTITIQSLEEVNQGDLNEDWNH